MPTPNYNFNSPLYNGQWQAYTPVLQGATDNPVATYTTQLGWFRVVQNNSCEFNFNIVTSTMTKTTTADAVLVSLPLQASALIPGTCLFTAAIFNATPVVNANQGLINASAIVANFRQLSLSTGPVAMTYAVTRLGVLTNVITFQGSGRYQL